jgi:hypothetical protein
VRIVATNYLTVIQSMIPAVDGHRFGDQRKSKQFLTKWSLMDDWNADVENA